MANTMTIEEAENREDVTIGKFSVTGYECVKSNFSLLTKETQEQVLEKIVRGHSKESVVDTVYDAATSIDASDPDWELLGVPQGLGQKIHPDKSDKDDFYSWSTTGDHPRGEAPRAAYFANELLGTNLGKGDKPYRAAVKPTHTVGTDEIDVIAYEEEQDLDGKDLKMDVAEMQRKCLENPMEDILGAFGVEVKPALSGRTQSQAGLEGFM